MNRSITLLFLLFYIPLSQAKEYKHHEPIEVFKLSESPSGKSVTIDMGTLDEIISDLSYHAKNYPPKFDSENDKDRASKDVKKLSNMLDILVKTKKADPSLIKRSATLNSIGHNLNIKGAAQKADRDYRNLLAKKPNDAAGNSMYGAFLAGSNQATKALPYLKKAIALGSTDAHYSLGMVYLSREDTEQALKNFESYKKGMPNDKSVNKLIKAIKSGDIKFKVK
jgi:tetratricopeptide (TPR) repeat protein